MEFPETIVIRSPYRPYSIYLRGILVERLMRGQWKVTWKRTSTMEWTVLYKGSGFSTLGATWRVRGTL